MTKEELKSFIIEFAALNLKAEARVFNNFYETDVAKLEHELTDDRGIVYLVDGDIKKEIANFGYEEAPFVIKSPLYYTGNEFDALIAKYNLKAPHERNYTNE